MAPHADADFVPTLTEAYSGVSHELHPHALEIKKRLASYTTPGDIEPVLDAVNLPPHCTQGNFDAAIEALRSLVGTENVELVTGQLEDGWYVENPKTHDSYAMFDKSDTAASAVVCPGSTAEVSQIVKWANQYEIPIYPISMGRNLGYGGAAARVRGSVVIDLGRRMNKILKIDAENATCLVEPGVSYIALAEALLEGDYKLMMDCPDLAGGSVLGNAVDHGVGYTPLGDHFANHCGMEVVLPNGEVIRTGMGAMPAPEGEEFNPVWQSFQYGYGPFADGIFSQSNYGIVTKMGFWLMPELPSQTFLFTFEREEDYGEIAATAQQMILNRVIHNLPVLGPGHTDLMSNNYLRKKDLFDDKGPVPKEVWRKAMKDKSILGGCAWILYGNLYGPPPMIQGSLSILKPAFERFPGTKFYLQSDLPPEHYIHDKARVFTGKPSLRELFWLNWVPNAGHLCFSPIIPIGSNHAKTIKYIIESTVEKYGFDAFCGFCMAPRETHCITMLVFNQKDREEKKRAFACMRELIEECRKKSYGEYRTHILMADQVARAYSWNNNSLLKFQEQMKDSLDPKGILAPGRNGIWPKKYRDEGWGLKYEDGADISSSIPLVTK